MSVSVLLSWPGVPFPVLIDIVVGGIVFLAHKFELLRTKLGVCVSCVLDWGRNCRLHSVRGHVRRRDRYHCRLVHVRGHVRCASR